MSDPGALFDESSGLRTETLDEPLVGYKLAVVRGVPPRIHPIGRYRRRSYEHLEPVRAVCHHRGHRPPAPDCTCGFHAVDRIELLERVTTVLADSVVLGVELGGTVVEHERGLRAEEQSVLSVGFPSTCSWCDAPATAVVPGRLWRSSCSGCARRRGGRALARADATAAIGVDVHFVDVPRERVSLRRWGAVRAGLVWLLSVLVVVLALSSGASAIAVFSGVIGGVTSLVLAVATARSRSSRPHLDWFAMQCACITVAALALRFLG